MSDSPMMVQSDPFDGSDWITEEAFPALNWYPQQLSWIHEPLSASNAAYNHPLPLRLRGPLNREALQGSLDAIVKRHAALRSVFRIENGEMVQRILPPRPFSLLETDLRGLGSAGAESKALEIAIEDAQRPFDLTREPLIRATLLQLGVDDHVLLLTTHDMVCDPWSSAIVLNDLARFYAAYCAGRPLPNPASSYSYGDFARQLGHQIEAGAMEPRFRFWMGRLSGGGDFHHLAADHPRPACRSYRGGHEVSVYSEELLNGLKTVAQREHVSPFMLLLAAFQCLLQRYSGQDDIGVATCVANRNSVEVEDIVGPFANFVILRSDLSGNPTLRETLRRCRETTLDAYANQDVPFGELSGRISPGRNLDRNPLFQTLIVLLNAPAKTATFPGLTVDDFSFDTGMTRYDLNVFLRLKRGLEVDLQYNTDLFDGATIRQISADYRRILELAVANAEQRVKDLPGQRKTSLVIERSSTPLTKTESELIGIWEEVFDRSPIAAHENFFDLGGDSVLAIKLLTRVRQKLRQELSIGMLFHAPTVSQLAALLEARSPMKELAEIVPIQPAGSRTPFFCIRAGPKFMPLAERLDKNQPFLGVELRPEVISHLPVPYRLEEFARPLADAIVRYQPRGPYLIGGFCASGLASLEVARLLIERGERVALLALFNAETPMLQRELAPKSAQLKWLAQRAGWQRMQQHLSTVRSLTMRDARRYVSARLNSLWSDFQSIVWQTEIDVRRWWNQGRLNDINQILYTAIKSYEPLPYAGRVVHFVHADREEDGHRDPSGGWRELVHGHFEAHEIPGGYYDILKPPGVDVLAARFGECLQQSAVLERKRHEEQAARHNASPLSQGLELR